MQYDRNVGPLEILMDAQTTTGDGENVYEAANYRNCEVIIAPTEDAVFTLKVKIALTQFAPDFSSPASPTNLWSYAQTKNIQDESAHNGNVGIPSTDLDAVTVFEINANAVSWFAVEITDISAGAVSVWGRAYAN